MKFRKSAEKTYAYDDPWGDFGDNILAPVSVLLLIVCGLFHGGGHLLDALNVVDFDNDGV